MACKISKFAKTAVLANRRSIIEIRGLSVGNGIKLDLRSEVDTSYEKVAKGTTRFDAGVGHHGVFKII